MIECHNVAKGLSSQDGSQARLWRLDRLSIARGERTLITGPSGCGKTTLLNLISGLTRPDSGSIAVDGIHVESLNTSQADTFRGERIGLIFQSFQLITPISILDNVLLGARYGRKWSRHEALREANHWLQRVGLSAIRHQLPGRMSLGEQQRVAIARALINRPPLLLADEPTASLDRANAENIIDLLLALCAEHGTTLVTISHDQSLARHFDRMVDASAWISGEVAANV